MTAASLPRYPSSSLRLAALLAYPTLICLALLLERPELRSLGLPVLAVALVGPWPRQRPGQVILVSSLALMLLVVNFPSLALWPPGLVCLAVALYFGSTLRLGQRPLIERIATLVHEQQDLAVEPDSLPWMRAWTLGWTLLLLLIGGVATVLAALDMAGWWLLWITVITPMIFATTLVGEYLLRRRRFPNQEHWPLGRFLTLLASIRPDQVTR